MNIFKRQEDLREVEFAHVWRERFLYLGIQVVLVRPSRITCGCVALSIYGRQPSCKALKTALRPQRTRAHSISVQGLEMFRTTLGWSSAENVRIGATSDQKELQAHNHVLARVSQGGGHRRAQQQQPDNEGVLQIIQNSSFILDVAAIIMPRDVIFFDGLMNNQLDGGSQGINWGNETVETSLRVLSNVHVRL